ncbi:MAG: glycosyltransferase family 39 protein [Candidatus Electryonea clarkiae]|nr:glycosyltransferase family 39 protein [Candidatus Electryonea clarkiae]
MKIWKTPVIVSVTALLLRLFYMITVSSHPAFLSPGMDAEIYQKWAQSIVSGVNISEPYFRAPLYPWIISVTGFLFSDTFWAIRLFQIILSCGAAAVLSILARRWFGTIAAWVAGFGWAAYGLSIYFDGEGLIASIFTSCFIIMILTLDRHRQRGSYLTLVVSSLLLGTLIILRANALVWLPVFLGVTIFCPQTQQKLRTHHFWKAPILALIIVITLITPVIVHNARTGGGLTISTQGGINLYLGNHQGASGAYAVDPDFGKTWTKDQIEYRANNESGKTLNWKEINRFYSQKATGFWLEYPSDAFTLFFKKILLLFNAREIGNNRVLMPYLWEVNPILAILVTIAFPLAAVIGLPFSYLAWRNTPDSRPALLFAATYACSLLFFFINARYRFPVTPVIILLAAGAVQSFVAWWKRGREFHRKEITTSIISIGIALIVIIPAPVKSGQNQATDWLFHKANALRRLNRNAEARNEYYRLLNLDSEYENAHLNIGSIWFEESKFDSAMIHYQKELIYHPDNHLAYNNLGGLFGLGGDLERAREYHEKALSIDPSHQDSKENLAYVLNQIAMKKIETGLIDEAVSLLQDAVKLVPNSENYNMKLAFILENLEIKEEEE